LNEEGEGSPREMRSNFASKIISQGKAKDKDEKGYRVQGTGCRLQVCVSDGLGKGG